MDEPFGAVDAFQRAAMQRELTRIWKATNASIIFVTHSLDEAVFLGNRVLAMTPGSMELLQSSISTYQDRAIRCP